MNPENRTVRTQLVDMLKLTGELSGNDLSRLRMPGVMDAAEEADPLKSTILNLFKKSSAAFLYSLAQEGVLEMSPGQDLESLDISDAQFRLKSEKL